MALYKADHVIERQFTNKLAKFVDLSRFPEDLEPLSEDFKLNQHKFEVIHKHLDVGPDLYRVQEEIGILSETIYSSRFYRQCVEVKVSNLQKVGQKEQTPSKVAKWGRCH